MRPIFISFIALLIFSCHSEKKQDRLDFGRYRAELQITETEVLPFDFEVKDDNTIEIFNAEELIVVDEIEYIKDSMIIRMPVFEGYFAAKFENNELKGDFIVEGKDRSVPFTAKMNETRFDETTEANVNITGNWETVFSPNVKADEYKAKGIFTQEGNQVTGTFRTETGDYRFLEGIVNGNQLKLSTFDGSHAFLFTGTVSDSTINGTFYSGNHWKEPFTAKRNDAFELADANQLTYLKEGYDSIGFTFPDDNGSKVSLSDARFKDKVVIVQIMGSWCPNCLDESNYYSTFYNANKEKGLEIVALAFEYAKTEKAAFDNIKRLKDRVGIDYPILLAQTGTTSKEKAQEKLPMLNHILSYPTTIFIDKKGVVRKIHTGFNGPATGDKYIEFKTEFEAFVNELLAE